MTEEWRPIEGFEGYYSVSSIGRVRSESRVVSDGRGGLRAYKSRYMKTPVDQDGYQKVTLCRDGGRKNGMVHKLVAHAFHGPRPSPGHEVCHGDGKRTNNAEGNLRWGTFKENQADRVQHGTDPAGERNPSARLTSAQARLIGKLKGQFSTRELARMFAVSRHTIAGIFNSRKWATA